MKKTKDGTGIPSDTGSTITRRDMLTTLGAAIASSALVTQASGRPSPPAAVSKTELHFESLSSVAKQIESRKLSPVELTEKMIARIKSIDVNLHSYVTLMEERAMSGARTAEKEIRSGRYRGPLHGVPIGIKDLLFTAGVPTMGGTMVLKDFVPDFNATVVDRLLDAGAVILGKNTLCEGAMFPYHPDLKVPVNPWDKDRWTGVSSSGSGVAVAAGLCFVSIGSDTGGSIRYPAAANGCVGLKPTYGRVSRYGVIPLAETLDHIGPMTRTVEDAAIVFDAIAGYDKNDPTSRLEPVQAVRPQLSKGIKGMRIGYDERYSTERVEPGLAAALKLVLEKLASMGAEIVEVEMPDVSKVEAAWWDLATVEAAAYHRPLYQKHKELYGPGLVEVVEYGSARSGVQYANAQKIRSEVAGGVNAMLSTVDCFVCPSMSNTARAKVADPYKAGSEESWRQCVVNDVHTKAFNFAGSPTLSVPCGFSSDGLPYSVQFVGGALSEAVLCRAGHAYEQASSWHTKYPDI
ncbi:MAG: amidase [Acidobacteriota bacterium]|nr:MAG: amidase [Acidobacteriota bacterium]